MLTLFVFMGVVNGYVTGRMLRGFALTDWTGHTAKTALAFPAVVFGVVFALNLLIWGRRSAAAVPFGEYLFISSVFVFRVSFYLRMGNCTDVVFYLQVCTVDHMKGGVVRLDATIMFSDECEINLDDPTPEDDQDLRGCSVMTFAHEHEDYDHDLWFSAYVPKSEDGCRVNEPCATGTLGVLEGDFSSRDPVQWWYMKDGAVLGGHNGMIIEYDPSTLAPLGMVSVFLYSYLQFV